jgi:hypothetical protein
MPRYPLKQRRPLHGVLVSGMVIAMLAGTPVVLQGWHTAEAQQAASNNTDRSSNAQDADNAATRWRAMQRPQPFQRRVPNGQRGPSPAWESGGSAAAGQVGTEVQSGRDVSGALEGDASQVSPGLETRQERPEREIRVENLREEPFLFDNDTGTARARNALRTDDDLTPLGVRAGAFLLRPSIELRGGALIDSDPDDTSEFLRLQPELGFESDWIRHRLEGRIGWREERFPNDRARDESRIDADLRLRLDATDRTQVQADVSFGRDVTSDIDTEQPANASGDTETDTFEGRLEVQHEFGRVTGSLRGAISRTEFGDTPVSGGGTVDSSQRDFTEQEVGLRFDYSMTDRSGVFVDVSVNDRDFDAGSNTDGQVLGSDGARLTGGVRFDNRGTLRGELGLGLQIQDPDDPALQTVQAFVVEGTALWAPTALTSVSLSASTELADSTTTGEDPDPTYNLRAGVAHALRRNVILNGGVGYTFDQDTSSVTFDAGFEYRLRREIAVVGDVTHTINDVLGQTDEETTLSLGLRLER